MPCGFCAKNKYGIILMTIAKRMDDIPFSGIRKIFEKVGAMEAAGHEVIHLEIGRPDFGTPGHIVQAAKQALDQGKVHYTSNYGISELRKAVADKLRDENQLEYDPESEIIVTAGANEAVFAAMLALVEPGDEVLIPCPCWPTYFSCVHMAGGTPVPVPVNLSNGLQLDLNNLKKKMGPRTKMLILNSPNNPSGAVYPKEIIEQVAALVQEHGVFLLSDEIYEKIIYDGASHISPASLPGMKQQTLTINGFSKAYAMTGWRLAYVAADKELISALIRIHQNTVSCATSFAQWGGLEALVGSQKELDAMVMEFERRRDLVYQRLRVIPGLSLAKPQGAFYAFVDISTLDISSYELADLLLNKAKVAVVPGEVFEAPKQSWLRISYAASYANLTRAMDGIEKVITDL